MDFYNVETFVTRTDLEKYDFPNKRLGVIIHITDSEGNILLQQRGAKSRDDSAFYTEVGGEVEDYDASFLDAIKREMAEEMGTDIKLSKLEPIGIAHIFKNDINWLFVLFHANYISGEAKIMEPTKCLGYKFFTYEELMNSSMVTEYCKFRMQKIHEQANN